MCGRELNQSDFPKNSGNKGGLDYACKQCHRDRMKARRFARANGLPMPSFKAPGLPKAPKPRKPRRPTRPPKEAAERNIFLTYRHGARRRGLAFELSIDDVRRLMYQPCSVCGRVGANSHRYGRGRPCEYLITYTGIDRIVNDLGYIRTNVQPMCGTCNKAKAALGADEFSDWLAAVIAVNK
jgi:hypothetical protein